MSATAAVAEAEARVLDAIAGRRDELVALAGELIAFDTTARDLGDPAREEAALQEHLAARLRAAGAAVEVWEPEPGILAGSPQVPDEIEFSGRPQLLARFPGTSPVASSLLFNGHVDAVSVQPRAAWASDPLRAEVRDGRLHGRGACDMKGGVAAMVLAAETLAQLGLRLPGDLLVNTVTDEEWNGAGGLAAVAHGVRADAGLVPEPTGFDAYVACRGIMNPTLTVTGRTGHADMPGGDWHDGAAVNAIEKAVGLLAAVRSLETRWRERGSHPLLAPGHMVPTVIAGGEWWVTIPAECRIVFDLTYGPGQVAADGYGGDVVREVEAAIAAAAAQDDWLAAHPPRVTWESDLPPAAVPHEHLVVPIALAAARAVGRSGSVAGMNSWHDAATFTRSGTPTISFGPGGGGSAHGVEESVPVDDLVACAQAYALCALRAG